MHLLVPCETVTIADRIVVVTYADATTARMTSKRLPKIGTYSRPVIFQRKIASLASTRESTD